MCPPSEPTRAERVKAQPGTPREADIVAGFNQAAAGTVGAEEEFMVLRPGTWELVPEAEAALALVDDEVRFTGELPASQVEARTTPCRTIPELVAQLMHGRRDLAAAVEGSMALASAGTHPLAPPAGELTDSPRYEPSIRQYGSEVLSRQLVFAFQVHVAPGDALCTLAVYNSLRSYLPEIAAIAANAPFLGGKDTGLESVRPQISLLLPRQGVPPSFKSWGEFAAGLEWGEASGLMPRPGNWWWELRPRPSLGTLEVRVPDAQTTVAEAAGVAALIHSLVMWLAERHSAGEQLPVHPSWQIAENRWLAARDGIDAALADLATGERRSLRDSVRGLLGELEPTAERIGCASELATVSDLLVENGAVRQQAIAKDSGIGELPAWLSSRFLAGI